MSTMAYGKISKCEHGVDASDWTVTAAKTWVGLIAWTTAMVQTPFGR